MTDVVITVQGRASALMPAERATLRGGVEADGRRREEVLARVTASAQAIRELIGGAGDAVHSWSSDTARAWSEKPWHDGRQLDPEFHARVGFVAVVTDAEVLARLVEESMLVDGVGLDGIEWSLSDESHHNARVDVRRQAVTDAAQKAAEYAGALGLAHVQPLAIADEGMLDGSGAPGGPVGVMRAAMAPDSTGLALIPQPIEVEAVVDARFTAS